MTIIQAIRAVDKLKPNMIEPAIKIAWLGEVDGMIWREIMMTHEDAPQESYEDITPATDPDHELLAKSPYADLYTFYLMSRISIQNAELQKYGNEMTLYNNAYMTFQDYWNRTHKPKNLGSIHL